MSTPTSPPPKTTPPTATTVTALRGLGLPPSEARVLTSLSEDGPHSQIGVARRLGLSTAVVCRAVRSLVDKELVVERRGKRDTLVTARRFEESIPDLVRVRAMTAHDELLGLRAHARALGIEMEFAHSGFFPVPTSVQPLPLSSGHVPHVVMPWSAAGAEKAHKLDHARRSRRSVISANGSDLLVPALVAEARRSQHPIEVDVVITSSEASRSTRLAGATEDWLAIGAHVRETTQLCSPFTIVDDSRACLPITIHGRPRQVWLDEPEQLYGLRRLFLALWDDARPIRPR